MHRQASGHPQLPRVARDADAERLTWCPSGVGIVPRLNDKQFNGHRLRRIPHPLDDLVSGVVGAYRDGSPSDRQAMLSEVTAKPAAVLCASAERFAAMAVRTGSVEPLRQALVAVGMAIEALDDVRDHLYSCAAVDHSAALRGTSFGGAGQLGCRRTATSGTRQALCVRRTRGAGPFASSVRTPDRRRRRRLPLLLSGSAAVERTHLPLSAR